MVNVPDRTILHEDPSCTKHGEGANFRYEPYVSPCKTAQELVHGTRQQSHGHPADNFIRTTEMWSIILGHEVTVRQFVDMMIALKLARDINKPLADNWTDIAGYVEAGALAEHELSRRLVEGT